MAGTESAAAAGALGPAALIPAGLGVLTGLGQTVSGLINHKKDKAELSRLSPAFFKVQDEYQRNENQAAEMAGEGLTQSSKDFYGDMSSRGLSSGISGILAAGGDPNNISRLFDTYNTSLRKMATDDSEAHINNIKYFQQVGKDLAGQKTQQWAINEYQPYQNKLKELTERVAADKQNIWNGIQGAIGGVTAGVTASQNDKLLGNLFKGIDDGDTGVGTSAVKSAIKSGVSGVVENAVKGAISDPFKPASKQMASPSVTQEEISAMTPDQFSEYMDSIGAKKY
jgi:hypothetical protein